MMSVALHSGVRVLAPNPSLFLPFLTRPRRCPCTTITSTLYVYLSLCSYLFPLVFAVSVVIPTSCCFFTSLIPSPSPPIIHGAHVNRTMTYDHNTPFLAVTIYPLLTSTDIILFYFFLPFTFFLS